MNIIYIVAVWPEPQTSGASTRVLQLIHCFKDSGFNVTVVSTSKKTEKSAVLENFNVRTANIELNNQSFDTFIQKEAPDMVLFDRFMSEEKFGWRVAESCPLAMRVLDTVDFHTLREARAQQYKKSDKQLVLQNPTSLREIASIYRCDLTLFVGDYEIELVKEYFKVPDPLLYYHPFTVDAFSQEAHKSFEERVGFIAIGSFLHLPNWDAVLQLKHDIWPSIRRSIKHATLNVVGSYAPEKAKALHNAKEGFIVKGFVEDDFAIMQQSRVHLAPLRFGAGVKSKCVLAFRSSTPTITTSIGAEGLLPSEHWAGDICDDIESFIAAAVNMHQCKQTFIKAQNQCSKITSHFQDNQWSHRLILKLKTLKNNLLAHREANFIGKMMLHHQLLSSRYLSKWIESKAMKISTEKVSK